MSGNIGQIGDVRFKKLFHKSKLVIDDDNNLKVHNANINGNLKVKGDVSFSTPILSPLPCLPPATEYQWSNPSNNVPIIIQNQRGIITDYYQINNGGYTSIEASIEVAGGITIGENPSLTSINLSNLKYVGNYDNDIYNNNVLTSINIESIEVTHYGFDYEFNPLLTTIIWPKNLKFANGYGAYFYGNALTQDVVDAGLVLFASLDGTNGTTVFSNQDVQFNQGTNAAPSSIGLAAKFVLEGRGCTVLIN